MSNPPAVTAEPCPHAGLADPLARARLALGLQAAVLTHVRAKAAATALATELALAFACVRVTVGRLRRHQVRLEAVSHGSSSDRLLGEGFDAIAAAMDEAIEQGVAIQWPAAGPVHGIRIAHTRLHQRHGGAVASVPLVAAGEITGALTLEWSAAPPELAAQVATIENLAGLAGPVLQLLARCEAPWHERAADRLRAAWAELRSPAGRRWRFGLGAAALVLAALLAVPVEQRIGGKARIEGERQRALVAPVAGFLSAVHVRPGDRVKAGEPLIQLADQDLQLQQRKAASELAQQENAYATALARNDRATMVVALGKAEEARATLALVEAELARSRIVAPFDGIVIQGDLAQSLGAPVERGQALMLVAPAERYRVVVQVDETDIGQVQVGQDGTLALSALPWDTMALTVRRMDAMARNVEGANVFEIEAELPAPRGALRPGLEGVAKIGVGRAPIAWTLLQRGLRWLRAATWAWLP